MLNQFIQYRYFIILFFKTMEKKKKIKIIDEKKVYQKNTIYIPSHVSTNPRNNQQKQYSQMTPQSNFMKDKNIQQSKDITSTSKNNIMNGSQTYNHPKPKENEQQLNKQESINTALLNKLSKVHKAEPLKKQKILVETRLTCSVCEEGIQRGKVVVIERCKHGLHQECLLPSLEHQLGEGKTNLSCPFQGCEIKDLSESFLRSVLSKQNLNRFYRFSAALFVQNMRKNFEWQPCPQPNCKELFKRSLKSHSDDLWYLCNTSNQKFCLKCNRKYHKRFIDCKQYQKSLDPNSDEYKMLTCMQQAGFKQCPQCRRYVQKNQGCNHITCKCKFEFCYACQGKYPECDCPNMVARRVQNQPRNQ